MMDIIVSPDELAGLPCAGPLATLLFVLLHGHTCRRRATAVWSSLLGRGGSTSYIWAKSSGCMLRQTVGSEGYLGSSVAGFGKSLIVFLKSSDKANWVRPSSWKTCSPRTMSQTLAVQCWAVFSEGAAKTHFAEVQTIRVELALFRIG